MCVCVCVYFVCECVRLLCVFVCVFSLSISLPLSLPPSLSVCIQQQRDFVAEQPLARTAVGRRLPPHNCGEEASSPQQQSGYGGGLISPIWVGGNIRAN